MNRHGRVLATVLCGGWLASQVIHMWADAVGHTPVTQLTRYLPAYFPIHAKRTLARLGLVDQAVIDRQRLLRRAGAAAAGQLAYPRQPLRCDASTPAPNILFVLIDALRPDAIDLRLLPNLAGLAARGAEFANHWSGGNSSRAGIFSLFYGLPSTYHEPFYGVQQPPVLVTHARESGYQLALFAAPGFSTPTDIERTVFAGTGGLPGERHDIGAIARNRAVTDDWLEWLRKRDRNRAFFGFLYYDPPMGEMSAEGGEALPLDERFAGNEVTRSAWRRYRLAARLVDGELGRVLDSLEDGQLMEHTIIVVASDHGYEFDDNGLGYMGHASNYSAAQLRATLVMQWPGRAPRRYTHRSSHFDVPVTLMQDAFGCRNDPADYAVGRNLYDGQDWEWLIAGSYNSHAIVEPGGVIVTHPGGFVEMLGPDYRPVRGGDFDAAVVARAMNDMRRFYR